MQVTVKLFASFRAGRFMEAVQDLPPGTPISAVIASLDILDKDVGIILVDGRHASADQPLHPGAKLALFPLLGGG